MINDIESPTVWIRTIIKNYINPDYINSLENNNFDRIMAKFVTIEILLNLLENNWNKDWYYIK